MTLLLGFLAWLFRAVSSTVTTARAGTPASKSLRLHVTRSMMQDLRIATRPTADLPEPLVLLHVRYASESRLDTVVAVRAVPFPSHAYIDGFAGASFDTDWLFDVANAAIVENAGLFLVHAHGGAGMPAFSSVDERTNCDVMVALAIGITTAPYGAMVVSRNSAAAVLAGDGELREMCVVDVPDSRDSFKVTA